MVFQFLLIIDRWIRSANLSLTLTDKVSKTRISRGRKQTSKQLWFEALR